MIPRVVVRTAGVLMAVVAFSAPLAGQDAPVPLPPVSPPPATVVPPAVVLPPANAVALCVDGSFVVAPAAPSECGARGGLKLTLPEFRPKPPLPSEVAAAAAAAAAEAAARRPARADTPPDGATMRCKDGTWLLGVAAATRCDANGGLAVILPPATRDTPPVRRP